LTDRADRQATGGVVRHQPLTLGTAGHVDHGKTTLIHALTGVDTDRLPEERERGISIALGYAPLRLPSGRRISVVDVPGHERFVRTMVSGATGVDLYLMTVAADDGVMPQTREHAAVLHALGIDVGVIAVTKTDALEPDLVLEDVAELLPGVPAVPVSARTGEGLDELLRVLDEVAATIPLRAESTGPALLHIDRAFTIRGAGTVVTGTLRSGSIGRGDVLRLLPRDEVVRVRGVQVHDEATERAPAGQRVAVNLTGVARDEVARGDVLAGEQSALFAVGVLDVDTEIDLHGVRVHVHHGTREAPARGRRLADDHFRLRLERPLMAAAGDRLVIRAVAPPETLGGAIVAAAYAVGAPVPRRRAVADEKAGAPPVRDEKAGAPPVRDEKAGAPVRDEAGEPRKVPEGAASSEAHEASVPEALDEATLAVEARIRDARHEPPLNSELDEAALARLRDAGRIVRAGPALHFHVDALADVEARVRAIIDAEGEITLARLRDELDTSRKFAQALLERLDAARVTFRRPDDSRVLRRGARACG
jgi:selenocysteine-specific elongation factor